MSELELLKERVAYLEAVIGRFERADRYQFDKAVAHGKGFKLGFFGKAPISQQTGTAGLTADATYGGDEVTMINEMHTALRAYGLLS